MKDRMRGALAELGAVAERVDAAAIKAGTGENGVFGLGVMRGNLGDLMQMTDAVYPGLAADRARLHATAPGCGRRLARRYLYT